MGKPSIEKRRTATNGMNDYAVYDGESEVGLILVATDGKFLVRTRASITGSGHVGWASSMDEAEALLLEALTP